MASSGSVFSQTLQSITATKLDELSKKRASFEQVYSRLQATLQQEQSPLQRLFILVEGLKVCFSVKTATSKGKDLEGQERLGRTVGGTTNNPRLETDLKNLDSFLELARFDPSVSANILAEWEQTALQHLTVQSLKYRYATLYGQVVTEWLSSERSPKTASEKVETSDMSEVRKLESRAEWEKSVFEPFVVNTSALRAYLAGLFGTDGGTEKEDISKAFKALKVSVEQFEAEMAKPRQLSKETLKWTIKGLISSDLLSDEKCAVLNDFLSNAAVLSEIADVLNMRMAALHDWSWGEQVLVEQRRRINGTYGIHLHADLLQAILLQFIGVKWAVFFKRPLRTFFEATVAGKTSKTLPNIDKKRREYYLGPLYTSYSIKRSRSQIYQKNYFLYQLPDSETQNFEMDDGEQLLELEREFVQRQSSGTGRTKQTARKFTGAGGRVAEAQISGGNDAKSKNPMEAKHTLLHLLSTEIAINTRLHGEMTCFHSSLDPWNSTLPHSTILTVLQFFGVSKKWLVFFQKFLEAPLKFMDDEESVGPRTRRRGTPGSHALSDVFGEVILFCLDFSVAQATDGTPLHRIYDDFWFWSSDQSKCVKAWGAVEAFTSSMGVSLSESVQGSARITNHSTQSLANDPILPPGQIRWGFLYLDPNSGRFEIDQSLIDTHIDELQRQLQDDKKSVFNWILAWNTYATTYFSTNFGKPANCFGRDHVDKMLSTYERIHRTLFSSSNYKSAAEYVKELLKSRFGAEDVPDGFLFFPIELGGLELKSPFISPLQIRDSILERPSDQFDAFEEAERDAYKAAKLRFDSGETRSDRHELGDPDWVPDKDADVFMFFEEYISYREEPDYDCSRQLANVFDKLMERPSEVKIEPNAKVQNGVNALVGAQANTRGILSPWSSMEPYWTFVAQLYGPELMDRFGGLNIVDPGLLPIGMVSLFRGERTDWSR